jgi:hypothetical protein
VAYTTPELVKGIVEVDDDVDLTPYIDSADSIIVDVCVPVTTYTTQKLELIERWLSAHFYCINTPTGEFLRGGSASIKIETKVDLGFDVTRYGQMAMRIDTAGGLSRLNKAVKDGILLSGVSIIESLGGGCPSPPTCCANCGCSGCDCYG